jgi:hypothetical protein
VTCGVVFVVARQVPVITLCFAGFPRDGIPSEGSVRNGRHGPHRGPECGVLGADEARGVVFT